MPDMETGEGSFLHPKAPGVYVTEVSAPSGVAPSPASVAVFVGYTEKAAQSSPHRPLFMTPVPINGLRDYQATFGGAFPAQFVLTDCGPVARGAAGWAERQFQAASSDGQTHRVHGFRIEPAGPRFALYDAVRMFFANGGTDCFVVSVANFWGLTTDPVADSLPVTVQAQDLLAGLTVAATQIGLSMLVVPDAVLLPSDDHATLTQAMLRQVGELRDRVAILDLPGALAAQTWSADATGAAADAFQATVAGLDAETLSFGAAYAPALFTTLYGLNDVDAARLCGTPAGIALVNNLLTTQAQSRFATRLPDGTWHYRPDFDQVAKRIGAAFPVQEAIAPLSRPRHCVGIANGLLVSRTDPDWLDTASPAAQTDYLTNALPLYPAIRSLAADALGVVAPSGAIAGTWARSALATGVWAPPAGMKLEQAVAPVVRLADADLQILEAPLNGIAVNPIAMRGAPMAASQRTMNGNSRDFRYVSTRRTLIHIEQSTRIAAMAFTFAVNDDATWGKLTGDIGEFLTRFWQVGGLAGATQSDAFGVQCGLGKTMTAQDILDGNLIVTIEVNLRRAGRIVLTLRQAMLGA